MARISDPYYSAPSLGAESKIHTVGDRRNFLTTSSKEFGRTRRVECNSGLPQFGLPRFFFMRLLYYQMCFPEVAPLSLLRVSRRYP